MGKYDDEEPAPELPARIDDDDHVWGDGWAAYRNEDKFQMSWDGGGIVGKTVRVDISQEEFEQLRNHDLGRALELMRKHDPNR